MNIKIGDKLVCKLDIINSTFTFYKDKQYNVSNIKYRNEYGEDITYKSIYGTVCYNIKDENGKDFSIICEYNENYIDEYEFNHFFISLKKERKLKLENLKSIFLL